MDGHVNAFKFFGAVPQSILYDNDRCLVVKIHKDGQRRRTLQLKEAISHYLFKDRYGRPGRGNDKGTVEGLVGYSRRTSWSPCQSLPTYQSSTLILKSVAAKTWRAFCGATPRAKRSV